MPEKISVLIHCYNNEATISDLLENVKWADEIVVCDSYSTDKTVEICKEYTDKVYQYEHKNSADQKNWAIPKCSNNWVLQIDTDERLEEELKEEILELMKSPNLSEYELFNIPFKNYLFGKCLKGADNYPAYHERLFRSYLRYEEKQIHSRLTFRGKIGVLKNHILHKGWEDMDSIRRRFRRHRKLCLLQKESEPRKYMFFHLIFRPPAIFLYIFLFKKGFIDCWRGIFFSGFFALLEFFVLKDYLQARAGKNRFFQLIK